MNELTCQETDYSKVWVEWVEPFSRFTGSDEVYIKIRATTAIKMMKEMHKLTSYKDDFEALMDFVVVHWASLKV